MLAILKSVGKRGTRIFRLLAFVYVVLFVTIANGQQATNTDDLLPSPIGDAKIDDANNVNNSSPTTTAGLPTLAGVVKQALSPRTVYNAEVAEAKRIRDERIAKAELEYKAIRERLDAQRKPIDEEIERLGKENRKLNEEWGKIIINHPYGGNEAEALLAQYRERSEALGKKSNELWDSLEPLGKEATVAINKLDEEKMAADLEFNYAKRTALHKCNREERRVVHSGLDRMWSSNEISALVAQLDADMVPIPGRLYAICKYEVSQALWGAVSGYNPSFQRGDDLPVVMVSWLDCQDFIERLNALPQVMASGRKYRFATAEEWVFACRGGDNGKYCRLADGTEITDETIEEVAWHDVGDYTKRKPRPVGQKPPNAFGLFDMLGNVSEWVEDDGEKTKAAILAGLKAKAQAEGLEVWNLRSTFDGPGSKTFVGGNFKTSANECTCFARGTQPSHSVSDVIGLRLACDVESSPSLLRESGTRIEYLDENRLLAR